MKKVDVAIIGGGPAGIMAAIAASSTSDVVLLEKNPNLRPVELKLLLYDSVSEKIKNFSPAWGILNVDNLMKML